MFINPLLATTLALALSAQAVPFLNDNNNDASTPVDTAALAKRSTLPGAPPTTANKVPVANQSLIPKTSTCGSNTYLSSDVRNAIQRGQQYIDAGTVAYAGSTDSANKANGYPHNFVNSLFNPPPQGCAGQTLEFPIITYNGNVRTVAVGPGYTKDNTGGPGPDRVIFTYANGALNYCGVATHTGAQNNQFVVCKSS